MTAYGSYGKDLGFDAAAAIMKYRFVKLSGNPEEVTPVTGVADNPVGVAQFSVTLAEIANGKGASVRVDGVSEIEVTVAVNEGDLAGLNADGTCSIAATGDRIVGQYLTSTAGAGRASLAIDVERGAVAA